jgi:outer membrane protein OmpA-like peptidoglycan-associated protein
VRGTTNSNPGGAMDWSNDVPGGANPEAGRMELMTDGSGTAAPGWFIDSNTAANPRGSDADPNYIAQFNSPPPANQYGWLRAPDDHGPASLWDFPGSPHDVNFDFETVAKGTDNLTVYGSLFWGFQIRSRAVVAGSEYAQAQDGASATFEEALERFRGYYVHEPVVLYFDTNSDTPIAGEEAKLAGLRDYLDRYPDVTCALFGYADVRGSEAHNASLVRRRAESAKNLLLLEGIGLDRITGAFGIGETAEFSQHGTAPGSLQLRSDGRLRANRRVEISFEHNVSGYPIVMP